MNYNCCSDIVDRQTTRNCNGFSDIQIWFKSLQAATTKVSEKLDVKVSKSTVPSFVVVNSFESDVLSVLSWIIAKKDHFNVFNVFLVIVCISGSQNKCKKVSRKAKKIAKIKGLLTVQKKQKIGYSSENSSTINLLSK